MLNIRKEYQMRRGFTLVELLVVIAIVFLLVAMLLPVMRSMRAAAMRVGCASNMQQLFAGFMMYANDHRGSLPYVLYGPPGSSNTNDWVGYRRRDIPEGGSLWQYIQAADVYLCPADSKWRDVGGNVCWTPATARHSYAVPDPRSGMALSRMSGEKALMVDESERTINDGRFVNNWDTFASRHVLSGWGKTERARAGGHILFCDGTVDFFAANAIIGADHAMFK